MLIGVIAEELLLPEAGRSTALFIDPDLFASASVAIPGFLLFEGQFDEGDTFYGPYIGDVSLSIYPLPIIDPDTVYAFTKAQIVALSPSLFQDADRFFSPAVLNKVLGPLLFTDDDLFGGTRKITQGKASINQSFPIDNVIDIDRFFSPIVERAGVTLIARQAALATETDVIYVDETTTSDGLLGSFVHEAATFTAPPLGYLIPVAIGADDAFPAPDARGSLGASLFTDTDVFFAPTQGNRAAPGAVFDSDIIFVPSAARQLRPSVIADADVFNGPFFTQPGSFALVIDAAESIPAPTVAVQQAYMSPTLLNDADAFYVPTVTPAINPSYISADEVFFAPAVRFGPLTVVVSVIDPEPIFSPVIGAAPLQVSLVADAETFFAPSMGITQTLTAGIVTDTDTSYAPTITQAGFDGTIALDGPIMPSTPQPTVIFLEG